MTSKKKKERMNGPVIFDSIKFYKAVKLNAQRHGFSELQSAIYGTLALEECLREVGTMQKLIFLSTIGAVALPDVEKLEPATEEEAQDKKDLIEFYRSTKDESKMHPLLDDWLKVNRKLGIAEKKNDDHD